MDKIYSVSELNKLVAGTLRRELGAVAVQGEVSGFRVAKEKLVFFELKDKTSRVLCFLMVWDLKESLEDGMEIRVLGWPQLFQTSGGFHLRVEAVELVGEGALRRTFEMLKAKLSGEGLFDESRKRPLPRFPQKIALVTSRGAAAFTDVLRILKNRWSGLEIEFLDVRVQGVEAARQIVSAINYLNQADSRLEAVILTRGGGSLEDLQAFNMEEVVRAVFASSVPVVVGVGHERDITLAELAADRRASTPSNAAEIMVPDKEELKFELDSLNRRLYVLAMYNIRERKEEVRELTFIISEALRSYMDRLRLLTEKIRSTFVVFEESLKSKLQSVASLKKLLISFSPRAVLKRGYGIIRKDEKVIRSSKNLVEGDKIDITLYKGSAQSKITKLSNRATK